MRNYATSSTRRTGIGSLFRRAIPLGFGAYELPGELSGSAVLGHPASLEPTAKAIVERCRQEGLRYLELRGSPHKYQTANPGAWLSAFEASLVRASAGLELDIRFIWIIDRRLPLQDIPGLIATAAALHEHSSFLVGLDLAGDEAVTQAATLAPHFTPAFEACLPITIHAGEGHSADSIWQAAYHLHADRIGHGLSLASHPALLQRFRDRGICLELCPSSNREVVGYADPAHPASHNCPPYPLPELWQAGVPVTLCTDNPGISRCTLASEYGTAARMNQGLSLWDALAMIKRGFVHAFADTSTRSRLIKAADRQLPTILHRSLEP